MIVEAAGRRYASMETLAINEPMGPRELVADVIRRKTNGSLTFRLAEDEHTVIAATRVDGRLWTYAWSKRVLAEDCWTADRGLSDMLRGMNGPHWSDPPGIVALDELRHG